MKRIEKDGEIIALIVDTAKDFQQGAHFISEQEWPLQLGLLAHPGGHSIPAHIHFARETNGKTYTQELLLLLSGKMDVDFYDSQGVLCRSETLTPGEALFQIQGGHGFRFQEPSRILEVKLGPYLGKDKDKRPIGPQVANR
jgi:hypothetical protein